MSDFYIDFREKAKRNIDEIIEFFKFFPDIKYQALENDEFTIVTTRADDLSLWGIYRSENKKIDVALAGRIAMTQSEWEKSSEISSRGGLACKSIYYKYIEGGVDALKELNGNFLVIINDKNKSKLFIVTDRCGMLPCFSVENEKKIIGLSSHPDILAKSANNNELNLSSMAEFLMTGKISPPYTYYKSVNSFEFGSIYTLNYSNENELQIDNQKYFEFEFKEDRNATEIDLAEQLSSAFKTAIEKRTLPIFGQTAISLSGGLDSRAILCSSQEKNQILAFCFFDRENQEYKIAKEIADSIGVKFIPFKRPFDYYGENAALGASISGAMGDLANNHYLGFRNNLIDIGAENIIAGFYCDYLFKGLTIDKVISRFLRKENIGPFRYQSYRPYMTISENYQTEVYSRLEKLFPKDLQERMDSPSKLIIESRRVFPLCYEPDNQETTIPQRVLPWYLPIVDNDILDVFQKIPARFKLNTSMYSKMVHLQCKSSIPNILNSNTGAKVNANEMVLLYRKYVNALKRKIKKRSKDIASDGSWPNWEYYFQNSPKIDELWGQNKNFTKDIFVDLLGYNPFSKKPSDFTGVNHELFRRIITQKLWLEQNL